MVDIHSHVLYGMDDGAKTFEDSLAMLRMAAETGTTDLVCTPHANFEYQYDLSVIERRLRKLERGIEGKVRLYRGCDFHLSFDNIEDAIKNPTKYTINETRFLLVEFPDILIFPNTQEIFARLQEAGMSPIITHPERNSLLRQRLEKISEWVAQGAYVQITAGSLTGHFGKRALEFSKQLLDHELAHFIASDAHDLKHRPPSMKEAHSWLTENYGTPVANALCTRNPRAVLTGGVIDVPVSSNAGKSRKWYQIWR